MQLIHRGYRHKTMPSAANSTVDFPWIYRGVRYQMKDRLSYQETELQPVQLIYRGVRYQTKGNLSYQENELQPVQLIYRGVRYIQSL